jgi:hypothetical protein
MELQLMFWNDCAALVSVLRFDLLPPAPLAVADLDLGVLGWLCATVFSAADALIFSRSCADSGGRHRIMTAIVSTVRGDSNVSACGAAGCAGAPLEVDDALVGRAGGSIAGEIRSACAVAEDGVSAGDRPADSGGVTEPLIWTRMFGCCGGGALVSSAVSDRRREFSMLTTECELDGPLCSADTGIARNTVSHCRGQSTWQSATSGVHITLNARPAPLRQRTATRCTTIRRHAQSAHDRGGAPADSGPTRPLQASAPHTIACTPMTECTDWNKTQRSAERCTCVGRCAPVASENFAAQSGSFEA